MMLQLLIVSVYEHMYGDEFSLFDYSEMKIVRKAMEKEIESFRWSVQKYFLRNIFRFIREEFDIAHSCPDHLLLNIIRLNYTKWLIWIFRKMHRSSLRRSMYELLLWTASLELSAFQILVIKSGYFVCCKGVMMLILIRYVKDFSINYWFFLILPRSFIGNMNLLRCWSERNEIQ